jgi:g-D-glutamyl-meso-diaminopimelate peptidase
MPPAVSAAAPAAAASPDPPVFPAFSVVDPSKVYTYDQMTRDLAALHQAYPQWLEYRSIGQTDFGREIWAVRLGHGPATVLINAAHHACEWLTAAVAMAMLDDYASTAAAGGALDGEPAADLLSRVTLWVVPMVNPDGVTLAQLGPDAFPAEARADLIRLNGGSTDFSRWKANARGIDLNRQYPADWEQIQGSPAAPAFANFKGEEPLTAPEVKALVDLTREVDPQVALAYHTAGRVIYWHFHTLPEHVDRDRTLALKLAALTGYSLVPPEENPSGGGYKDWFVQAYGRPGFTLEIGPYGEGAPLTPAAFPAEWERNRLVGVLLAQEAAAR